MFLLHKKQASHQTQKQKILIYLIRVGKHGAFARDLERLVGWKFSTRISELRAEGYVIELKRLKHRVTKYYLIKDEEKTDVA